jgi:hypothetical protein
MQVNISCAGEEPRFGISSTGIGVEWSQLEKVTNLSTKASFGQKKGEVFLNDSDGEIIKYDIIYNPFQII